MPPKDHSRQVHHPAKNQTKRHPARLWIAFLVLGVSLFAFNMVLFFQDEIPTLERGSYPFLTGKAVAANATVSLCINSPPTINLSGCANLAFVGTNYSCDVIATDTQQAALAYGVSMDSGPAAGEDLFDMVQNELSFIAAVTQAGDYILRFSVDDLSNCGVTTVSEYFNLTINHSSNAPYLVEPLPNKTWAANVLLIAFDLDDYFADPNNDPLSYLAIGSSNLGFTITNGEVLVTPASNWCGTESVLFRATDPTNLSADSNIVLFNVTCPPTSSTGSSSSSGSSGGGGGGSGLPSQTHRCVPDYTCFAWSTCQLTRAVSEVNGTKQMVEVTGVLGSKKYIIPEEESVDPSVYYQGFSYRDCVDSRSCDSSRTVTYIRSCDYKPSCSDSIQNQGETGVDCGGPCAPCGSCVDGIQNNAEEGVDCGGPVCQACNSCTNGKLDGRELGVDCGGPDCAACPTCFDNIKNQDETEVDCGGQWCNACEEKQFPMGAAFPWLTAALILLIGFVLVMLFLAALKRRLAALLLIFAFKHKKKNRTIILPRFSKEDILRRLAELEAAVELQPMLKSQEELARIIRDYFKESLKLDFEFTYEELVDTIAKSKLNPILARILQQFFRRISLIEFSGVAISPVVLRALIQETRELVYQTAVLTIDDLKEREKDLALRDIPKDAPSLDRAYLLLSQIHLCLQFKRLEVAAALYQILQTWYDAAKPAEQRAIYDDFNRVYEEYLLAKGVTSAKALPAETSTSDAKQA